MNARLCELLRKGQAVDWSSQNEQLSFCRPSYRTRRNEEVQQANASVDLTRHGVFLVL